jgi:hypothetical protein
LVKAAFPNLNGALKTGQYVKNRIITGSAMGLSVPVTAVLMQAQQPFVYRVLQLSQVLPKIKASTVIPEKEKTMLLALPPTTSVVVQTPVKLGQLQDNRYELISGLQKGARVVVSNTALLRSGMPVKVSAAASPSL